MDNLKSTISKNLVELRTQAQLTQLQLAQMLNYSDKAVSKWERGEAIPDLRVLIRISEIYGVTLDDLVKGSEVTLKEKPRRKILSNRAFITALSVILLWFVATGVFALFYFIPATSEKAWLSFVCAPLPTGILLMVFSAKWGNRVTNALASSLILWACVLIARVFVWLYLPDYKAIFVLYIVAAVFEILILLWFTYRWFSARKR